MIDHDGKSCEFTGYRSDKSGENEKLGIWVYEDGTKYSG